MASFTIIYFKQNTIILRRFKKQINCQSSREVRRHLMCSFKSLLIFVLMAVWKQNPHWFSWGWLYKSTCSLGRYWSQVFDCTGWACKFLMFKKEDFRMTLVLNHYSQWDLEHLFIERNSCVVFTLLTTRSLFLFYFFLAMEFVKIFKQDIFNQWET